VLHLTDPFNPSSIYSKKSLLLDIIKYPNHTEFKETPKGMVKTSPMQNGSSDVSVLSTGG